MLKQEYAKACSEIGCIQPKRIDEWWCDQVLGRPETILDVCDVQRRPKANGPLRSAQRGQRIVNTMDLITRDSRRQMYGGMRRGVE